MVVGHHCKVTTAEDWSKFLNRPQESEALLLWDGVVLLSVTDRSTGVRDNLFSVLVIGLQNSPNALATGVGMKNSRSGPIKVAQDGTGSQCLFQVLKYTKGVPECKSLLRGAATVAKFRTNRRKYEARPRKLRRFLCCSGRRKSMTAAILS